MSSYWHSLRALAQSFDWTLQDPLLSSILDLFTTRYAGSRTPADLTREYARDEFLLPLAAQGAPVHLSPAALDQARSLLLARPAFRQWFREARLAGGAPALLAARWLCHLIGLRHATVEIFIDPPALPGHTLVQVRGLDKFEAPAAFDMPCAGHVTATDSAAEALRKELGEELNLQLKDLEDLRVLGYYQSITGIEKSVTNKFWPVNIEYRTLYCARIKSVAVHNIRFTDGEVAGLAVFTVPALRDLLQRFPERVASGLSGAMPFYPE